MDKKTVLKVFSYQIGKNTQIQLVSAITGLMLSLLIIFLRIMLDNPKTYVIISPLLCSIMLAVSGLGLSLRLLTIDFINAVKMGVTRKNYLAGTCLCYAVILFLSVLFIFVSAAIESAAAKLLYANAEFHETLGFLGIPFLAGCGAALLAICLISGAVILKTGLKGAAVMYFILCLSPSLILSRIEQIRVFISENSYVNALAGIDTAVKLLLAAVVVLAALVLSARVYLKKDMS